MRDALSDLLQAESRYAPVVDGDGRIAGVLSVEIISEFLTSRRRAHRGARGRRAAAGDVNLARPAAARPDRRELLPRPHGFRLHRGQRGLLLRLGRRQLRDRYVTPTLEHLVLVSVSVALGFAIAFGMALLSHRRRWLVPPFIGATGILYTIPSLAFFFLLLPITGRGTDTAIIALTAYNLQIIYRNIVAGLANVPAEAKDAGRGHGHDRPAAALAGRAAARCAGDHRRAADRDGLDGRDRDARGVRGRAAAWASSSSARTSPSRPERPGGGASSRSGWRSSSTSCCCWRNGG